MRELDSPPAAPDAERVTMEQAGREFCQRLELKGRRKSHRLTVASDLRNHIAPFFAGKTLDRILPADIERYVAAKRTTLAVKTIRNRHADSKTTQIYAHCPPSDQEADAVDRAFA